MSDSGYKIIGGTNYVKEKKETKNDKLTIDLDETMELWVEEGYKMIDGTEIISYYHTGELDPSLRLKCRYITKDGLARCGGLLKKIVDEEDDIAIRRYVILENMYLHCAWCVQCNNVDKFFFMPVKRKEKKDYKDPEVMNALKELVREHKFKNAGKLHSYCMDNDLGYTRRHCREYFLILNKIRNNITE